MPGIFGETLDYFSSADDAAVPDKQANCNSAMQYRHSAKTLYYFYELCVSKC
jgi:hypothetical protein